MDIISDAAIIKKIVRYGIYNTPAAAEAFRLLIEEFPPIPEDIIDESYWESQQDGFIVPPAKEFLRPGVSVDEVDLVRGVIRYGIQNTPSAVEAFRPISDAYPLIPKEFVDDCYCETQREGFQPDPPFRLSAVANVPTSPSEQTPKDATVYFKFLKIQVQLNEIIISKKTEKGKLIRNITPIPREGSPRDALLKAVAKIGDILKTPNHRFTRLTVQLAVPDCKLNTTDVVWMFGDALKNFVNGLANKVCVEELEVHPLYVDEVMGLINPNVLSSIKILQDLKNYSKEVDWDTIKDNIQFGILKDFEMVNCELNVKIHELAPIPNVSASSNIYAEKEDIKAFLEMLQRHEGLCNHKWNVYHPEIDINTFFDEFTLQCDSMDETKRCLLLPEHMHFTAQFCQNEIQFCKNFSLDPH